MTKKQIKIREKSTKHSILRAQERYNIDFSVKDIGKISHLIQTNQSVIQLCNCVGANRQVHKLKYLDNVIFPVYDYSAQNVVTFLTKEMVDNDIGI